MLLFSELVEYVFEPSNTCSFWEYNNTIRACSWGSCSLIAYHRKHSFAVGLFRGVTAQLYNNIWTVKIKTGCNICMYRIRVILIARVGIGHPVYYFLLLLLLLKHIYCKVRNLNQTLIKKYHAYGRILNKLWYSALGHPALSRSVLQRGTTYWKFGSCHLEVTRSVSPAIKATDKLNKIK